MSLFVRLADWQSDRDAIRSVRQKVFVEEQQVPPELEWDEFEESAQHFLIYHDNKPIGTGRLTGGGKIGRMAILKEARGLGAGLELLQRICKFARVSGQKNVYLNAQVQAVPFYEKAGFAKSGDEFMEAGIPHVRMDLTLSDKEPSENADDCER
ncbi:MULTISPECIES: GNAT family N-acetyltransferase [Microbulbifer]|uniref:GNAT family N-acetyltransferase n=1 Tax=Microbulbifer salipaludis TaxID=187980 RepID=A0ABS3E870_9GAMM|nr:MULTISPECIES: GNAT family N-acetyltransferase [Microbulbifer]MBN8431523.1 GNAT family N-acetyltransferase [Microbulbifer salipaludis]